MLRRTWVLMAGFAAVLAAQGMSNVWAQDNRDESREERFFRYLDRDNDGRIAGDELRRLDDRMKDRLREAGLDPERDISKDRFVSSMQSSSRDSDRGGDGDRRSSSSRSASKSKVVLTLTEQFKAHDKNGDNQVALYEWDRARYAEFMALDRNGDGFLTARELDDPAKPTTATSAGLVVPGRSASTGASPAGAAKPSAATPAGPPDSPEVKTAKLFFSISDKDKNGEISADEWNASKGVRAKFENAKIAVSLPLKEGTFVEQFLQTTKPAVK